MPRDSTQLADPFYLSLGFFKVSLECFAECRIRRGAGRFGQRFHQLFLRAVDVGKHVNGKIVDGF